MPGASVCQGCGSALQSDHPDRPGYVPEHVLARTEETIKCRRCYRIEQYGTRGVERDQRSVTEAIPDPVSEVRRTVEAAGAVVLLVDIWDFEGSFLHDVISNVNIPVFIVVNKVDLLPSRTPPQEILQWVKERCSQAKVQVTDIRLISAERGTGVKALRQLLESHLPSGGDVALVGVTNVGKSALVRSLLPKGKAGPTASSLPGTTQRAVMHPLGRGGLTLIDTPGLIPGHRIADHLCGQCSSQLIPKRRLKSKLVHLGAKKAIILGGLAALSRDSAEPNEVVTLAFASERVPIHHTRSARVLELLQGDDHPWLHTDCTSCRHRTRQGGWEDVRFTVKEGEDLVVPGLGWISPRGSLLDLTVTLPAGSMAVIRPRLIGSKVPAQSGKVHRKRPSKSKR